VQAPRPAKQAAGTVRLASQFLADIEILFLMRAAPTGGQKENARTRLRFLLWLA